MGVRAETLADSIKQALSTNPAIETVKSQKIFSEEEYKESRSDLFPVLSANATAGRIFGNNSTSRGLTVDRGEAYSYLGEGGGSITQPLFDGFEVFNRMDAAKARVRASDYTIADTKENIALRAAQAHIAILQARDTLEQTKAYYGIIQDYQNRIQIMVDEGVADETELAQAKNISIQLESTLADIEGQLKAAYANYREVAGTMPKSDLLKPDLDTTLHDDIEMIINEAKKTHPLLMSGREELVALTHEVDAEKSTLYPDIDGELSYLKRDQREEIGGELEDARAVLKMNWNFETGGAQKARKSQKKASYLETLNKNKEIAREIEAKIRQAYVEYETASKQKELVKTREITTKELFDAYNTQFEGARVRLLQLMQAENQLFNTQLEAILAEYRYLLSQINLLASTGQLTQNLALLDNVASLEKRDLAQKTNIFRKELDRKEPYLFGDFDQVFIEDGIK
jgi:adhesin transport system outer membrane protein